jgi:hypothetical protein
MELTKTLFIEAIPNVNHAIRTASGESVVDIVKRKSIYRMNIFDVSIFGSVAFESVFFALRFGIHVEVFNSDSAFN